MELSVVWGSLGLLALGGLGGFFIAKRFACRRTARKSARPAISKPRHAEDEEPLPSVETILGIAEFLDPVGINLLGIRLCQICFRRLEEKDAFRRLWVGRQQAPYFNAVYLRKDWRGKETLVVVRNEVNGTGNTKYLSDVTIRRQCEYMLESGGEEAVTAASKILGAIEGGGDCGFARMLLIHDVLIGKTTRLYVAGNGDKQFGREAHREAVVQTVQQLLSFQRARKCRLSGVWEEGHEATQALQEAAYAAEETSIYTSEHRGLEGNLYRPSSNVQEVFRPSKKASSHLKKTLPSKPGLLDGPESDSYVGLASDIWPGDSFHIPESERLRLEAVLGGDLDAIRWKAQRLLGSVYQARHHLDSQPQDQEAAEAVARLSEELSQLVRRAARWRQAGGLFSDRIYAWVEYLQGQCPQLVFSRRIRAPSGLMTRQTQRFPLLENPSNAIRSLALHVTADRSLAYSRPFDISDFRGRKVEQSWQNAYMADQETISDAVFTEIYSLAVEAGMSLPQFSEVVGVPLYRVALRVASLRLSGSVLLPIVPSQQRVAVEANDPAGG